MANPLLQPRSFLILAAVALIAFANVSYQSRYLQANDDYLWLADSAFQVFDRDRAEAMHDRYVEALQRNTTDAVAIDRAVVRRDLGDNYLFQSAVFRLGFDLTPGEVAFDVALQRVMYWGYAATLLIVLGAFAFALSRQTSATLAAAVVALSVCYLLEHVPFGNSPYRYFPTETVSWAQALYNLAADMLQPAPAFSPFSNTPRDRLTIVVLMLFLLRWSGHYRLSHLLLLIAFFIHREYAGLLAAILLALDLVMRPRSLQGGAWLMPVIVLGAFVLDSPLAAGAIGYSGLILPIAIAAIAVLGFGVETKWVPRFGDWLSRAAPFAWLTGQKPASQDMLLFALLWLVTLPLAAFASALTASGMAGELRLWDMVHGRVWGFMYLAVLTALALPVVVRFDAKSVWIAGVAVAGALTWSVVEAGTIYRNDGAPFETLGESIRTVEADLDTPLDPTQWGADERRVYLAMIAAHRGDPAPFDRLMGSPS